MILILDNYDSFTYNLVQLIAQINPDVQVVRNDEITVKEIKGINPSHIVISPGPGRPENAGICINVIKQLGKTIPILGVCLGHQAIGYAEGAQIVRAPLLMHGKTSQIKHTDQGIYSNVQNPFEATRYHSLIIDRETLPGSLEVTAQTADGIIMGIRHKQYPIEGIQFHPESILTQVGPTLITNWVKQYNGRKS